MELTERRMLEEVPIALNLWGNRNYYTLLQVFHPTMKFAMLLGQREREMGVMEHVISLAPGEGFTNLFMRRRG